MNWFAELAGAALYGLAFILVIVLAFCGVFFIIGGNYISGIVAIALIVGMWGGRKYYRKRRPARQSI